MDSSKLRAAALDSLCEGLRCWQKAESGDARQYQFAILHISRYFELCLKYAVSQLHPLLIFKKPYAKDISDCPTITPEEAFYILRNAKEDSFGGLEIEADDIERLAEVRRVRNYIEHYFSEIDHKVLKDDIGIFFEILEEICVDRIDDDITVDLPEDLSEIYETFRIEDAPQP